MSQFCCFRFYNALLGVHNYQKNSEQKIFVEKSFPHKEYTNAKILENDIMLLKVKENILILNFKIHMGSNVNNLQWFYVIPGCLQLFSLKPFIEINMK